MSYYTKITKAGLAAITAAMNNSSKVPITYMAFGDGNGYIPEPDENATSLVNEVYRVGVNKVEVHSKNPNWLVCEAIIPSAVGGFNIREVALYDSTGNTMLAIANYPPTYKPTVEEGAAKIQTIRIVIQVDNSGNFELIVDPDVVLATIQDLNVIKEKQIELNKKLENRTVYFEDFISDSTGTIDVTAEIQSLLDSHDGDIYAKNGSIFKTTNTLFNRKHNRTIDFHNAKIVNKTNSRYAIVTISPAFTGSTDAELNTFITERHYGQEVKCSHVVNLHYEMLPNTGGGANLGVGIVYGYKCKLSRMFPSMTNGNGVEIRNSLRCGLYRSEIENHRNYACFVFMSQRCEIVGNKFKGGARGVCTKMNRDGDTYCGHIIAFNTFEDATDSGRAIIGGEWREKELTHEIYVQNHEWVDGNQIYENTFINTTKPQTISMCVFSRNWKIYSNTFKWNNLSGNVINIGGEGNIVAGEKLGGNHEIFNNYIYDYNASTNALITSRLSNKVFGNDFFNCRARHWYYALEDIAGNKIDYAHFFNNHFLGDQNGVYCNVPNIHGFVATDKVEDFKFNGNYGLLNIIANGSYTGAVVVASNADTTDLQGGDLSLIANTGVNNVTGAVVYRGTVRGLTGRKVNLSAPATAIALQLQSGVEVQSKHENNTYILTGAATTARAVVNNTDFVDGVNSYIGAWSNRIFNNFEKSVSLLRRDRQASVMPATGTYQKGDFVRNTNPSIVASAVVFGWVRITDGDNHVLNTDWVEIKQSVI